jgi:hypothetical protein
LLQLNMMRVSNYSRCQRCRQLVTRRFHAEHHTHVKVTLYRLPGGIEFTGGPVIQCVSMVEQGIGIAVKSVVM